ncbi:YpmA family protein [Anaerobacillus sp. CMMVII]|uniref:YpmA family protein n=1 Tax=Anaerobacillus sp. CMMVII TaxID=2755588 RepID=UPI0021B7EBFD|nr:YpmA family protein [Anaerobacillus sp. CMMVII]MCT8138929.1 YpmA family protein [Anaerobacillus sp. CMMVII]
MSKIEVISTVKVTKTADLYKIVDACNKSLKDRDLMFGLASDEKDKTKMVFTIYHS